MKNIIIAISLLTSGLSYGQKYQSNLGEMDLKDCECKTCLIENGVCIRTQTNGERYTPDKSSKPKKGSKANSNAGAVKS